MFLLTGGGVHLHVLDQVVHPEKSLLAFGNVEYAGFIKFGQLVDLRLSQGEVLVDALQLGCEALVLTLEQHGFLFVVLDFGLQLVLKLADSLLLRGGFSHCLCCLLSQLHALPFNLCLLNLQLFISLGQIMIIRILLPQRIELPLQMHNNLILFDNE
jgi:hypothetical protein